MIPDDPRRGPSRTVRWAGEHALLVECGDLEDVVALHAHLAVHPVPGQREAIAAATTVLVDFHGRRDAAAAVPALAVLTPQGLGVREHAEVQIDVVYDGEDLDEVARLAGMDRDAVIRAHTGGRWVGAFGGFAPGFTYCAAHEAPFDVPRRTSPRTSVPAGSVAVAGRFSAVYPRSSPGGWQLLGRTDAVMWDVDRDAPALVRPGDHVRYRAVRPRAAAGRRGPAADRPVSADHGGPVDDGSRALVITAPGLQTLVKDPGHPGAADLGVPGSGAADREAARTANGLVGNPDHCAILETLLGGVSVQARGHHVIALAGAEAEAVVRDVDGTAHPVAWGRAVPLYDGQTLDVARPEAGLRTVLAVRGGIDVPAQLGSRASDTLSGLGPSPLAARDELPVGSARGLPAVPAAVPRPAPRRELPRVGRTTVLRVCLGPRDDWFDEAGLAALTGQDWAVTDRCDRVGVRLAPAHEGRTITRCRDDELPSEGVVLGSLQVPPSGEPVLFLADHPVTGGYPVIAVVLEEDLALAAQLPPGARVRFAVIDPDTPTPSEETRHDR